MISAIVAIDGNNAIGRQGQLLCRLPDDLRRFKALTTGHAIVMGRKTFESFPKGALPDRQNIVVTRNAHYHAPGITVAHSLNEALAAVAMPGEVFIIGGEQIYRQALDRLDRLYITLIHHRFADADAFFPEIDPTRWHVTERDCHGADERHPYPFSYITLTAGEQNDND